MREALERLPVQVVNLASEDLWQWKALTAAPPSKTRFISTNLVPKSDDQKAPERFAVVEATPGGGNRPVRFGFLGMTDPSTVKPNSGFRALDPMQAFQSVKTELLAKADLLIVLGDLPFETARRIAQENSEVAAVILLERRFMLPSPEQVNNAVILHSVERGRYLGQLRLDFDSSGKLTSYEPELVEMGSSILEEPEILALQEELKARLR